jgi:5-methylcytosine-specific restriction enzyme subunit McrC
MLPFLVNMGRLFELFVYEWMSKHLHYHFPTSYRVVFQQKISVGTRGDLHFDVDLIIEDRSTGTTKCVLDTKYKDTGSPSASDVAQVVAYATGRQCTNAILVYPNHINYIGGRVGLSDTIVTTSAFPLDKDIDEAGHRFLDHVKTIIT